LKDKGIIISHPTGNANVRAALKGFQQARLLEAFYTTVACFPGNTFDRLGRISAFSEFRKRSFDDELQSVTRMLPFREISRLAASRAGLKSLVRHEYGVLSVDAVYRSMDKYVARHIEKGSFKDAAAVYAYEDGAAFSFRAARAKQMKCLYDLPIGYWRSARKLLSEERELRPDWAATLTGFMDSEAKLARKDEELSLSDHVFVASSFTAASLKEYPAQLAPVSVIPYGFPAVNTGKIYHTDTNKPLKLLFVGGLSQRKGIANVFEAVKGLEKYVQLTVVGGKSSSECKALDVELSRHTWIQGLPHHAVLELMREHDVLLFPSLFEGFGLVITEAMSQGTPVMTTDRTAGPDLIENGRNGWLIEAGSTRAIKEGIENILADRTIIESFGRAALETASKRPWSVYGRELSEAVLKLL
jgi:glycosyltransferase involved in cell wall biosynthesis